MLERINARMEARAQLAETLRIEHPAFVTEIEQKYGIGISALIALFGPLIMRWLEAWLDKQLDK